MIVALLGATASGKSSLAEQLADRFPFVIVNGDPFQAYRGMEILSASPTADEMARHECLLYSCREVSEPFDAPSYQKEAREAIGKVKAEGRIPLFVSGSGLYLRSALFDYEFPKEGASVDLAPYNALSNRDLHVKLEELDPYEASKIHENNRVRVLRAIEICLRTGKRKSDLLSGVRKPIEPTLFLWLKLPREEIYSRIDRRVEQMKRAGLVEEVRALVDKYGYDAPGLKAIGAKELFPYLRGERSLEESLEEIKKATRRYAKRQETFFAHQFNAVKITGLEDSIDAISSFLSLQNGSSNR